MTRYSVAEAKNGLSRLVADVEAGRSATITRHGRPIADVVPARQSGSPAPALDWITRRRLSRPAVSVKSVDVLRELDEDDA